MAYRVRAVLIAATLLVLTAQSHADDPDSALVTFYSNGSLLRQGLPGLKHSSFNGAIFDGERRLAVLRHNRFVTLRLPTGQHLFSASYTGKHPADNSQLTLVLAKGAQYFIRVESESRGVVVVDFPKGLLEVVGCQKAQEEGTQLQPLESKHIAPEMRAHTPSNVSLPSCQVK